MRIGSSGRNKGDKSTVHPSVRPRAKDLICFVARASTTWTTSRGMAYPHIIQCALCGRWVVAKNTEHGNAFPTATRLRQDPLADAQQFFVGCGHTSVYAEHAETTRACQSTKPKPPWCTLTAQQYQKCSRFGGCCGRSIPAAKSNACCLKCNTPSIANEVTLARTLPTPVPKVLRHRKTPRAAPSPRALHPSPGPTAPPTPHPSPGQRGADSATTPPPTKAPTLYPTPPPTPPTNHPTPGPMHQLPNRLWGQAPDASSYAKPSRPLHPIQLNVITKPGSDICTFACPSLHHRQVPAPPTHANTVAS